MSDRRRAHRHRSPRTVFTREGRAMVQPWLHRLSTWPLLGVLGVAFALAGAWGSVAVAAQPIRIGFSMGLTGPLAANGKAALLAMEIWKDDVNKAGGLLGRPVE